MSNTTVRILTALVAVPILLVLFYDGGIPFTVLIAAAMVVGVNEYFNMAEKKGLAVQRAAGSVAVVVLAALAAQARLDLMALALTVTVLLVLGNQLRNQDLATAITGSATTVFGVVYIGWLLSHALLLRFPPKTVAPAAGDVGLFFIVLAIAGVFLADAGAYFVGRAFGRRKIYPLISPGKSWEGAIGGLAGVNARYQDNAQDWDEVGYVVQQPHRPLGATLREKDWREFIETRPPERTGLYDINPEVVSFMGSRDIPPDYDGPRDERGHVIRSLLTYDDLAEGKLGPDLLERFLRSYAPARYIAVDTNRAAAAWQRFLAARGLPPDTPLTERIPPEGHMTGYWSLFVQNDCPVEAMRLLRPEDHWRAFLEKRYGTIAELNRAHGTSYRDFAHVRIPYDVFKYACFLREKPTLRRRYFTHNFKRVFEFVAVHGAALKVTLIYVILMITGTLTVNPLAAYAMSRFRLKESHHILVFLLATMAFPGEVLMIPVFLLIKSFPYAQMLTVALCILGFYGLVRWLGKRLPFILGATLALLATGFLAGWAVPKLAARFDLRASVSLMNTFWALVLPGLANGYGIFLLKGFFDTLPPELYEAGLIDGAGELRMFWKITLPLCKPILAVMALGAFGAAYGAFMHAFLICQDPKMWTFMVFLYEFQQLHIVPMIMAALVVAAIPTLLVFIFCQNIILRGIVIPTFK